jgi:hypothetical protein
VLGLTAGSLDACPKAREVRHVALDGAERVAHLHWTLLPKKDPNCVATTPHSPSIWNWQSPTSTGLTLDSHQLRQALDTASKATRIDDKTRPPERLSRR